MNTNFDHKDLTMVMAALFASLALAGSFTHAEESSPEGSLASSVAALPYTVDLDSSGPLQLVWKDGSRIAEMQIGTKDLKFRAPMIVSQNTCGNKSIGEFCSIEISLKSRGLRMIWKKHPETDRVGKTVILEQYDYDTTKIGNDLSVQVNLSDRNNASIMTSESEKLSPMTCTNTAWLPPAKNGIREILSLGLDSMDNNPLSPQNLMQTSDEVYNLEMVQEDASKIYIRKPANPYFHIGNDNIGSENTDRNSEGGVFSSDMTTYVFKQADDVCQVQIRAPFEISEFLEAIEKAPTQYVSASYIEILKATERPLAMPDNSVVYKSALQKQLASRRAQKFIDKKMIEKVFVLEKLGLIKGHTSAFYYGSSCRTDVSYLEDYCSFRAKEMK